jgi:hypothetical protein
MADKEIIISRMQQRRGNRIDLPQPLRAGEVALASDSKEVFIGLDPKIGVTAQNANSVSVNNITNGFTYANSYLNNNFVRLIMPSKRFPASTFDGTANNTTFVVTGSSGQAHGLPVFNASITSGNIKNVFDNSAFESTDFTGAKNGSALSTNATRTAANLLNNEFFVSSPTTHTNTTLTFGTNPTGTDDITLNYYSNADIISAFNDAGNVGSTATVGFYNAKNVASYRQFNNAYIRSDYEVGTAFVGMENKHVEVFAESGTISASITGLTDIKITRTSTSSVSTISLSSATTLQAVVNAVNNANIFAKATFVSTTNWYISADEEFSISYTDTSDASTISMPVASYTRAANSIKGQLEDWIHGSLGDATFNMFVAAEVGNKFNSGATRISKFTPSTSSENLTITMTGNQEAENFSTITNKIFGASANAVVTGLTNVKTNQRLLTQDDYSVLLTGSANSLFEAITKNCVAFTSNSGVTDIVSFGAVDVTAVIIEYSVRAVGSAGNAYSRTGTLHLTADTTLNDSSLNDTGAVMHNGFGTSTFDLSTTYDNSTNTFKLTATNNLTDGTYRSATFKYLVRKWLG